MSEKRKNAPACLNCIAAKAAATAERAADKAASTAAEAAEAAEAVKAARPSFTFRRVLLIGGLVASYLLFTMGAPWPLVPPPVHYVAEIEWADGGLFRHAFATESACVEYTREMGADVAAANCYTETR